jgi:Fe-S-cluster containining protein
LHAMRQLLPRGHREGVRARCRAPRAHLRIAPAAFLAEYTTESEDEGTILRRTEEAGCVFLDGTACTVYDARPDICQRFPHVVRGNGSIASRMWQFIDRACYCPIVYNALEAFKVETGFRRRA